MNEYIYTVIEYKIYPTMCFPKVQSSTSWDPMGYEWVKADRGLFFDS